MDYRAEAASLEGFIQQLAVGYLARGYWFYVGGPIPDGKDPRAVDAKLIDRYGVAISKFERARRKVRGLANVQYLRYGQRFVLVATPGEHRFFREESGDPRLPRRAARDRRLCARLSGRSCSGA